MTACRAAIKRHPVLAYYILTFTISWGGILVAVGGPGGIPETPEQVEASLPFVLVGMLAGPSLTGGRLVTGHSQTHG